MRRWRSHGMRCISIRRCRGWSISPAPDAAGRRFSEHERRQAVAILEQTVDVNVAPDAAYAAWMRVEDYPRFMQGVLQVRRAGEHRLHWHARRHEQEVEWDSEITETVPN